MDRTLSLSDLYELLYDTLSITEEVKRVLRRDCDEATFVLKPWKIKTVVEKTNDSICTCKEIAGANEAEEIAAGIDRAIILAQELREKLELNVTSRRKPPRRDTVEDIYLPTSISNRNKISRNNVITMHTASIAKNPDYKGSITTSQNVKVTSVVAKELRLSKSVGDAKRSGAIDRLQSKMSSAQIAGKLKREKNFILENKLNVKRISSANKLQVDDSINEALKNSRKSLPPEASAAELNELIDKMTRRSAASIPPGKNIDCPLHGENAPRQSVQERIVTIDLVEALRHFNVPNEIVKTLRMYHTFLKTETDNSRCDIQSDAKEDKYRKSLNIFLQEFETMNATADSYLLQEPHLHKVTVESISAFNDTFNGQFDSRQFDDTKRTLAKLAASLKLYNNENVIKPIIFKPSRDLSLARGWISNSIWNISCMDYFQDFSKAYNIRYRNKKQLLSLHEAMQKLQRTEYLNTLIRIVLRDVIPTVKSNVSPTSAEYARAYKMMFILHQGLNPKLPVLVRTDN